MREQDPVHWNDPYKLWVITKYKDLVWVTRRPEAFSSEVFHRDPLPPYPSIDESDMGLYEDVRNFFSQWFIQTDRRAVSSHQEISEHGGPRPHRYAQGHPRLLHPQGHGTLAPPSSSPPSSNSSTKPKTAAAWTSCATTPRPCPCWSSPP